MCRRLVLFLSSVVFVTLCGCASYPVNPPLERIDENAGYRLGNRTLGEKNSDDVFVILGLSGGGTRAAALDYGVIKYLDRIRFGADDRSLLDEVDLISSSSGASLPAAYYGVFGQAQFLEKFADDVLYQKLQSAYIKRVLNPLEWPRLASGTFSRGDLAVEYFDKHVFDGRTFAQMQVQRPYVMLNATDMGTGSQFSFVQGYFDLICSDLSQVTVARAVTASLAFTPGFTPITLKNYNDGRCGYETPGWVKAALEAGAEADPLLYAAANNILSYEAIDKRPYIHLLDSGISDNIGIRTPQLVFRIASQLDELDGGSIRKLVIILVDAKPKTWFKGDMKAKPPGMVTSVQTAASRPLANYSYETVNLLKRDIRDERNAMEARRRERDACAGLADSLCDQEDQGAACEEKVFGSCLEKFGVTDDSPAPGSGIYLVHVSFELIDDQARRESFQTIPTSLQLPRADIDRLIDVAPELMNEDPEFHTLLRDLGARVSD